MSGSEAMDETRKPRVPIEAGFFRIDDDPAARTGDPSSKRMSRIGWRWRASELASGTTYAR